MSPDVSNEQLLKGETSVIEERPSNRWGGGGFSGCCGNVGPLDCRVAANVFVEEPSEFGVVPGVALFDAETLSFTPTSTTREESLVIVASDTFELMTTAASVAVAPAADDDSNAEAFREVSVVAIDAAVDAVGEDEGVVVAAVNVVKLPVAIDAIPTPAPTTLTFDVAVDADFVDAAVVFVDVRDDAGN